MSVGGTAENAREKTAETITALENEKKQRQIMEKELAHKDGRVHNIATGSINGVNVHCSAYPECIDSRVNAGNERLCFGKRIRAELLS